MAEVPHDPRSPLQFPPELPISARVRDIAEAIQDHPVVIVAGATGSGKTTQLPKIALALGRGLERLVGVTQPRRIAATSVAARVAAELGSPLGADVGYQIRFDDRTSPGTYVKFMTDGILLAEIQGDPKLLRYDTLILDEAHERSLTIDFLLGWVKRILPERPDLKVIVSSATLETERFSAFFGGAPVITVEGRTFPVEVLYEPPADDDDLPEAVARAVENVTSLDPRGDILVFLPGEREIREADGELARRNLRNTVVLPLYGRLSGAEQSRVFSSIPQRRVVLATNVAETSITLPGIVYVIDTGLARLSRYDPRSGTTRLQIEGISQASADQRKGRCGRVREGICIRLYDEQSFAARPAFTDPEIKRTGLAGVILRMKALGLGAVEDYPFLDPPLPKTIAEGYRVLEELGALTPERELTPLGRTLARFPTDPRIARMIVAGEAEGALPEVLVVAAALTLQDPRERPQALAQKADEAHRRFRDERSDFVTLLRLWAFVGEAQARGTASLRRACKESFLSFVRVREWMEVHRQLQEIAGEVKLRRDARGPDEARGDALHRALLTGLLSRIGQYNPETRLYTGAKQTRFALHPSSGLARKPPAWVMAFELVETSQLYARMAAKIDPEWLAELGGHLLRRSYSDPHWSEKTARASVKEHATLFGLPVRRDHHVDYAAVAPAAARRIFLEHALVRGEYKSRGAFQERNRALLAEVARLRDKARRSDMLADDDALLAFFDARVPDHVATGKAFEAFREEAERRDPDLLALRIEDVLAAEPELSPAAFPDTVTIHGAQVPVAYRFDPSAEDDGITLTIPLPLLVQLAPGELDWTIPGWHREKLTALLYEMPKALRRELGDLSALGGLLAETLKPFQGPLAPAFAEAVFTITGVRLPPDAVRPDAVAAYLRITCRLVDGDGREVAKSRDVADLLERYGAQARAAWSEASPAARFEKKGLTAWDFGELPPFLVRRVGAAELRSYPALVDRGRHVDLVLAESAAAAESETRAGVRRLLMLAAGGAVTSLAPRLPRALPSESGGPVSREADETFRGALLRRIVDEAFGLEEAVVPRSRAEFQALLTRGVPRLAGVFAAYSNALAPIAAEVPKVYKAMKAAASHPGARAAVADVRAQLAALVGPALLESTPLSRLVHLPRYVKACQVRLERAQVDPRKDDSKAAPLTPLLVAFEAKARRATDREAVQDVRWSLEELRVAIFAPELKTAVPVSLAKVKASVDVLR